MSEQEESIYHGYIDKLAEKADKRSLVEMAQDDGRLKETKQAKELLDVWTDGKLGTRKGKRYGFAYLIDKLEIGDRDAFEHAKIILKNYMKKGKALASFENTAAQDSLKYFLTYHAQQHVNNCISEGYPEGAKFYRKYIDLD